MTDSRIPIRASVIGGDKDSQVIANLLSKAGKYLDWAVLVAWEYDRDKCERIAALRDQVSKESNRP